MRIDLNDEIKLRKLDHLFITLLNDIESGESLLEEVELVHNALPDINFDEVSTSTYFLNKKISAPVIISGMTGGHHLSAEINAILAEVAEEKGLAMGVGSQRAGILDESVAWTYRIARERGPTIPLIANIGVQQLLEENYIEIIEKAVEMIEADAIAIHLNPAQEVFQPEGDLRHGKSLERLSAIRERVGIPVIVKETGCGISREVAELLKKSKIHMIDVSGKGGTSWIKVEMYRAEKAGDKMRSRACKSFYDWGIPTAISVLEVKSVYPEASVICSGGVRTGLDIAKCIALGADYSGIALPFLRAAIKGKAQLMELVEALVFELKAAMFLTGSLNLSDLKSKRPVLGPRITSWLAQRGIRVAW